MFADRIFPGQNCFASDALMRVAAGRPAMSLPLKSRPRSMGTRSALAYPAVIKRTSTSGCSDMGTTGRPSTAIG